MYLGRFNLLFMPIKKLLFCLCLFITQLCAAQKGQYHVIKSLAIKSDGRWDYIAINPMTGNLYVSHATQVNVVSKNGDSVAVINNTTGVHGIAFAPAFGKGFISNGKLNTITVFDIETNKVITEIKVGENPDAIMYEPYSKRIIVCDGKSKDITVIDPKTNTVVKTIPLDGKPETAVSNEKGKIYVNIEDKSKITVIDAKLWKIDANWPLQKGEGPSGLAIDLKTQRLFAGCENMLVVMDAGNGKVIAGLPIGAGCDGVAFDAGLRNIYSSNGEGTLSIYNEVSANKYQLVENVVTKKSARTLVVDPQSHLIYLPAADMETVSPAEPHTRPNMIPGTFQVLVVGK